MMVWRVVEGFQSDAVRARARQLSFDVLAAEWKQDYQSSAFQNPGSRSTGTFVLVGLIFTYRSRDVEERDDFKFGLLGGL
jgi:hypothetical protein